jgi:hypothetical protein
MIGYSRVLAGRTT